MCRAPRPHAGGRPASIDHISFHDCVVRAVARRGRDVVLADDRLEPAGSGVLILRAVTAIRVDGTLADDIAISC